MSKHLGISTKRPGATPEVPPNADDFITRGRPLIPDPELVRPEPASPPQPVASVVPVPAPSPEVKPEPVAKTPPVRRERSSRVGPEGGVKTVLANGNQRITISLEPDLYEAVRELAFKNHIDITEVIRRGIRGHYNL